MSARDSAEIDVPDLEAISRRWALARMAGEAATDAGEGWDQAKINALVRSWQDVAALHRYVKALTALPAQPRHRGCVTPPGATS